MKKPLDIANWARKEHFHFFRKFEEPFFGLTVEVNCEKAHAACKANGYSFFLYYLHKSLLAANRIEPFRYTIEGDEVMVFDKVNASPTIMRPNNTFGFAYIEFFEDFAEFEQSAKLEIERVRHGQGLDPSRSEDNVIHYSSVPWLKFTSVSHARSFSFRENCPKIVFGKLSEEKTMPLSIHVHHALMDGFHVAKFVELFQQLLDEG